MPFMGVTGGAAYISGLQLSFASLRVLAITLIVILFLLNTVLVA